MRHVPFPHNRGRHPLLPDRASLNSLLGVSAATEDFERFNWGGAPLLPVGTTISSSSTNGRIVDGVTFSGLGNFLDIVDKSVLGGTQVLDLPGFTPYFPSITTGTNIELTILAPDDVTIVEQESVVAFFQGTFIGASDPQAIGGLLIGSRAPVVPGFNIFDTAIDNVAFGTPVPEPSTLVLLSTIGAVPIVMYGWRCRKQRRLEPPDRERLEALEGAPA